ncbi:MAG: sensor histidine kinase KdpD [Erysipelotrichia bacterium]|nr:sensor histidine kinase KdpD [Erysipelotrichia bacterium]
MKQEKDAYELLKKLHLEVSDTHRGKLKIFFGYAAGVGKTYAMLEAAHAMKEEGHDVVVGYVEGHKREETNALLTGLEVIPALVVLQSGIKTWEFDLEAALKRKPEIILVDELAHTNASTLTHKKRYQDIEELLEHGINVYTTLNVQHLESLNDKVSSITHILVNERIPDYVFDKADQVELVDIEVEELIQRLKKGKIYQSNKIEKALNNFFSEERLVALREIAMRRCADRINQKEDRRTSRISNEHILVCISASPSNANVIRSAARMANAFHAQLTALFVEGSNIMEESEDVKKRLRDNFRLAQSFDAQIAIVSGIDLPLQIAQYAKISNVSKIIIGRSKRKSYVFSYQKGFIDQLIAHIPDIEIYVIPDKDLRQPKKSKRFPFSTKEVVYLCVLLFLSTGIALCIFFIHVNHASVVLCYVIGSIFLSSKVQDRSYIMLYSFFSVLLFNYFFIEPYHAFEINEKSYVLTFVLLIIIYLLIYKSNRVNKQRAKIAVEDAYFANALLVMSKIMQIEDKDRLLDETLTFFSKTFKVDVAYYEKKKHGFHLYTKEPTLFVANEKEEALVKWVFENGKPAGKTSDTLSFAKALYLPVKHQRNVLGCMAFLGEIDILNEMNDAVLIALLNQFALRLNKH